MGNKRQVDTSGRMRFASEIDAEITIDVFRDISRSDRLAKHYGHCTTTNGAYNFSVTKYVIAFTRNALLACEANKIFVWLWQSAKSIATDEVASFLSAYTEA